MTERPLDPGQPAPRAPVPRKGARLALEAEVTIRRSGHGSFRVRVYDASPHGCKIAFVERPRIDDRLWVKFDGLEALQGLVCWVDGFNGGVEFEKPIHPAVFESLITNKT